MAPDARWHHIAGVDNPADCLSCGITPHQLRQHNLWWQGPSRLRGPSVGRPSHVPPLDQSTDLEERSQKLVHVATVSTPPNCWDLIDRFSQLKTLLRTTAWIMRAISRFRGLVCPASPTLTTDEMLTALRVEDSSISIASAPQALVLCGPRGHSSRRRTPKKLAARFR